MSQFLKVPSPCAFFLKNGPESSSIFITFLIHLNVLMLLFTDGVSLSYIGLVYYEWKEKDYLMTFTASKKLNRLLEVI